MYFAQYHFYRKLLWVALCCLADGRWLHGASFRRASKRKPQSLVQVAQSPMQDSALAGLFLVAHPSVNAFKVAPSHSPGVEKFDREPCVAFNYLPSRPKKFELSEKLRAQIYEPTAIDNAIDSDFDARIGDLPQTADWVKILPEGISRHKHSEDEYLQAQLRRRLSYLSLESSSDEILDPIAREEENEKQKKENTFTVNAGKAMDTLNADIPVIFHRHPNWDIYTGNLELDLSRLDGLSYRLLKFSAPGFLMDALKIKGLIPNIGVATQLQEFRKNFVLWDDVKVRSKFTSDVSGNQIIECRWNARLGLKPIFIPRWASPFSDVLLHQFPGLLHSELSHGHGGRMDITVEFDAVSQFYLNSEGKIYRHVIDDMRLLHDGERMQLSAIEEIMQMSRPRALALA